MRIPGLDSIVELLHSPRSAVGQVALGRALLLTCGVVVASTIWWLNPTQLETPVLGAISVLMVAVLVLSPYLRWTDGPSRLPLLFPLCVL